MMGNRRYQTRKAARVVADERQACEGFTDVSRGDGMVGNKTFAARQREGGVRGLFAGAGRGHGASRHASLSPKQAGFSLMEIIIVTVLIGGIVAFAASQILDGGDRANYRIAEAQLQTLAQKIELYRTDTGSLPGSLQDLVTQPSSATGWLGPYAKASDLVDPWKTPVEYRVPGDGRQFDLVSLGADRAAGGQSLNADIRYE